jgi:alpha-glucosidase
MFWPDRTEIQYWAINDQFLLGDQLLVAPILEEGESQREVTLPPGRWYDFWSGESLQSSSQPITVKASIDSIPIFCKEGALLPLEQTQGELVIQYYATDKAASRMLAYELYSDLGDGPISRETNYRIDLLYVTQSEEKVTIEREGTGAFMLPYGKMTIQVIGWSIASCKVDGQLLTGLELDIPMNFQKIELYRKV